MRRRRFLAWGLGVVTCAAGCGTERVVGDIVRPRTRFSINPAASRWARVCRTFAGLARTAGYETGTGTRITVTGLPELAASELNRARTLDHTATPLSRLIGDVEVVVVPTSSRFKDFDEFGAQLLARPGETMLAGGPQGEPDHLLFGLIAKGLGADTRQVDYTGYAGSQEAVTALLSGKATAAAGLLSEWRASIGSGRVRALAVSSAVRVADLDVPTLLESGVRVDFTDWVAAVGPESMSDEKREAALRMCDEVTGSPGWEAACRANGWTSIPLSGDDFVLWLASEVERTRGVLRDLGLLDTA
ncbi:Bug family tripartite tricarboxylate transporter substrate binding protein [Nonomuraea jiangxiensis]|uniref:Putative tricarboxylic transport membrane protein n=1 Tax=Nonomuraea jiangxiensis TaxID=633440 RepID=A0A1G8DDI7_9ACTN|nr:tripartite tricarboxylate transporter substrate-binding protein [Nonomuraea jiangxiensis]SDH55681.1 putative tricarboxylic transport membrane protein [Nonomuraea jiangxiensis]